VQVGNRRRGALIALDVIKLEHLGVNRAGYSRTPFIKKIFLSIATIDRIIQTCRCRINFDNLRGYLFGNTL